MKKVTPIYDFYTPEDRRTRRWIRLVLLGATVLAWSISGVILTAVFFALWPEPRPGWAELLGNCLAFLPLFLLLPLTPVILKKRISSIFRSSGSVRGRLFFLGAWSWGTLLVLESVFKFFLEPGSFRITLDWAQFLPALFVALILVTMQASSEEMLFRSAIPAAIGGFTKNPFIIISLSGVLFGVPHLSNPEANSDVLVSLIAYSLTGCVWGWVTYRSGGLELAIGAHAINNIYGLVLVGYDNSAVSTSSILKTAELDMASSLFQSLVMFGIWLVFLKARGVLALSI